MKLTIAKRGLTLVLCLAVTALWAPAAVADTVIAENGEGAGKVDEPEGLAIDVAGERLYVADKRNRRIDVFDVDGTFLEAFGWGVADGEGAELQSCTTTCFAGLKGGGAGQFGSGAPTEVAVDNDPGSPSYRDVYVVDGSRIQKFTPNGEFLRTWGGGVITGGAAGKGDLSTGSTLVENVETTAKAFEPGQTITAAGIPAETVIAAIGAGTITLSKPASASGAGVALTVAEGPGNVPVNELQMLSFPAPPAYKQQETFQLSFRTENPSPTSEKTPLLPYYASPGELQAALEALPNIGAGNVSVTSPNPAGEEGILGGPYTIEFTGPRFADTDVEQLSLSGTYPPGANVTTVSNGANAAEICTAAIAQSCASGVSGNGEPGQLTSRNGTGGPLAIGPGGSIYFGGNKRVDFVEGREIFESRLERFDPEGSPLGAAELPGDRPVSSLAVDQEEHVYLTAGPSGVRKFDWGEPNAIEDTEAPFPLDSGKSAGALTIDQAGNLLAAQADAGTPVIGEYGPTGETIRRYGYARKGGSSAGIAAYDGAEGELFATSSESGGALEYLDPPPPGPIAVQVSLEAATVGNAKATLKAKINPEGEATSFRFEYVDQQGFEEQGESFAGPHTKSNSPEALGGTDFWAQPAEASIGCVDALKELPEGKCLTPETTYHFRVVAEDAEGRESQAVGPAFTTKPPLEIGAVWAARAGLDTAQLEGEVNPFGIPASGYFEYVDDASYGESGFATAAKAPDVDAGEPPIDFGVGEEPAVGRAALRSLEPGTTYHFRLRATDPLIEAEPQSAEATFSTLPSSVAPNGDCPNQALRPGASAQLPDCRAYELVSPVDKNGGDAGRVEHKAIVSSQSAVDGNGVVYSSATAFAGAQSAPLQSQYLASRGSDGWRTEPLAPPRGPALTHGGLLIFAAGYSQLSPDLCEGWMLHAATNALDPAGPPGYPGLYGHDTCAGGPYLPLSTTVPPNQDPDEFLPEFQGASADGSRAIFTARDKLTPEVVAAAGVEQLYEWHDGVLRAVCVLPSNAVSGKDCTAGTTDELTIVNGLKQVDRAISADGRRIYFSTYDPLNPIQNRRLYLRTDGQATAVVSQTVSNADARFWTAAVDGSKAIFTIGGEIDGYDAGGSDLYEYRSSASASHEIAGEVLGVVGASDDAERVYFVSREARAAGAQAGKPNLYLYEADPGGGEGSYALVATVAGLDALADGELSIDSVAPVKRTARVTPDGRHLAFMSTAALSGQDNTDIASGEPDANVYLYAAASGELSCVSCNPTGARPAGRHLAGAAGETLWAAAQIPPWDTQLYAQRALAADGSRLFFESYERLVAADTNGKQDVYEWEAYGRGDCAEPGGCVRLVSSGHSPSDSLFLDASPDGEDVFISTEESLVAQDPGLRDVYDARVGGGLATPAQAADCEGDACQSPPPAPAPPEIGSASFDGPGNASSQPVSCARIAKRAKRLSGTVRRARRAARRSSTARTRRRAARMTRQAKRASQAAKRCRRRARAQRRASR